MRDLLDPSFYPEESLFYPGADPNASTYARLSSAARAHMMAINNPKAGVETWVVGPLKSWFAVARERNERAFTSGPRGLMVDQADGSAWAGLGVMLRSFIETAEDVGRLLRPFTMQAIDRLLVLQGFQPVEPLLAQFETPKAPEAQDPSGTPEPSEGNEGPDSDAALSSVEGDAPADGDDLSL